ncbi:hypothetical protein [Frankia nepalensis]|uniref:Uncharacterized protein n=1 Tax=Frankia nepalensis TaxID=1836974 RepID=A0A937RIA5_9ACTN|nr:hypothetical protein [Frankia nepalensis]MBL7632766.1 hypothetical protein [Frankia nepalensis]
MRAVVVGAPGGLGRPIGIGLAWQGERVSLLARFGLVDPDMPTSIIVNYWAAGE